MGGDRWHCETCTLRSRRAARTLGKVSTRFPHTTFLKRKCTRSGNAPAQTARVKKDGKEMPSNLRFFNVRNWR